MPRLNAREGFALPFTLFLIAILTVLLTAAFAKVQADRRVADASGATVSALATAKSGLHNYLGSKTSRPADGDSVRVNVTGGYADVVARVARKPVDTLANWLYIVRSTGHIIDPTQGKDPQAVRTIAQFAQWQTGSMMVRAAYTSVDGINSPSSTDSVVIDGNDACGVDTARYGLQGKNNSIPTLPAKTVVTGKGASPSELEAWNQLALIDSTRIDWNALVNGGFSADHTSYQAGSSAYSSQLITGTNQTITDLNGTGLLIVQRNLTLQGTAATWKGIIIVGGKLTFDMTPGDWVTVNGAVISGLNTGNYTTDFNSGNARILYNSCEVGNTMAKLTGFAPITNGWVDNWAAY